MVMVALAEVVASSVVPVVVDVEALQASVSMAVFAGFVAGVVVQG